MSSLSDEHLEALEKAWKQFIDSNDKGIIDFDEFSESIERLHCGLSQNDIRNVFKLIDQQNSGHIDQSDFIKTILCHDNNNQLSLILKSLLPKHSLTLNKNNDDDDSKISQEDDPSKWRTVFEKHFGGMNTINQDIWIDKMLKLNIDNVDSDDLRLFHACLDSQFRSCFDFDEFYETFTIHSLHHQQMDQLRDKLKNALLPKPTPKPKPKPISKPLPKQNKTVSIQTKQQTKKKKETREISIQTEMFNLRDQIKNLVNIQNNNRKIDNDDDDNKEEIDDDDDDDENESDYDEEIENLEKHILEEEKYLEIMDEIDNLKKRNSYDFKWENANLWNEYQVINWLNDVGFKNAKYVNTFKDKGINGDILLNNLNIDIMINQLKIDKTDALLIDKSIFILKNIKDKVFINSKQSRQENDNNNLRFYKQKCEHLNRELVRMKKIEQMFKRNRRETEAKLKQLECNLYFGSISQSHLMQKFDIDQLFEIQKGYHKTLANVQQCIETKVNAMKSQS